MKTGLISLFYPSPVGVMEIKGDNSYIYEITFVKDDTISKETAQSSPLLEQCASELDEYFAGARKFFDLPLLLEGTTFQKRVWEELAKIPYGKTLSYSDIANIMGNPGAVRAVGGANHSNPVSIIIPCHRVIGKDGSLTGYGGGLWRKQWLLEHEIKHLSGM
ncbi:MAG TPA: methylated-DNA--[protein]-cysteine S-methyltransferase [Synergistales bacterium]|nr:methylated-DNA--[protein]-cysteine S-methyltransferase [Synergistales bacterium]